jgi:prevent-host-death family protein
LEVCPLIDLNEVFSLTEFQRNAKDHVERLAQTGKPQVLTVNGKAAVVVQDAASYQRMLDEKERLEAAAGIQRSIEAMKRGETRPLEAALDDLKTKYE